MASKPGAVDFVNIFEGVQNQGSLCKHPFRRVRTQERRQALAKKTEMLV